MVTSQQYQVDLIWKEDQINAKVSAVVFSNAIEVASHSCLKNLNEDVWSAEHLFIASIESSYMTAFFRIAKNKGIKFKSFSCTARASVMIGDEFSEITDIIIRPTVTILESNQINKTLKLFSVCKDHCLVLNTLKIRLHIFPSISVT
jgi:organic hydroperoxide reductase OsmC/OhrA